MDHSKWVISDSNKLLRVIDFEPISGIPKAVFQIAVIEEHQRTFTHMPTRLRVGPELKNSEQVATFLIKARKWWKKLTFKERRAFRNGNFKNCLKVYFESFGLDRKRVEELYA